MSRSGKAVREGIRILGGDTAKLGTAQRKRGDIAAYLELHIEQGGILDAEKIQIGVVEGIVGNGRWDIKIEGFANHAGTTPMSQRRDALVAAARIIDAINRVATSMPGHQVGTVGRIEALPGAYNVIPGEVVLGLDLRDLDAPKIERLYQQIAAERCDARRSEHGAGGTDRHDLRTERCGNQPFTSGVLATGGNHEWRKRAIAHATHACQPWTESGCR